MVRLKREGFGPFAKKAYETKRSLSFQRGFFMRKKRTARFAYPNARAFVKAYLRQDENNYRNDFFYFRGGSKNLANLEDRIAKLVGVDKGSLALTTSGMSAVMTAFEISNLTQESIVVHGKTEYGQIYNYIDVDLRAKGVVPMEVDTGSISDINKTLCLAINKYGKNNIKAIFFETVGNGPETPVLDIEKFLALPILQKINPFIILDNTLPTNAIVSLASYVKKSKLKIIGLESTTKFYLMNQDLGGLFFTFQKDLLQQLLTKRKRIGATPGPSLIEKYQTLLPKNTRQFNKENAAIMRNTFLIAKACSQAKWLGKKFIVSHPNLSSHKNYHYVNAHFKNGCTPVFFVSVSSGAPFSSEKLFYLLEKNGAFKDTEFSESFGFYKTGVSYGSRYNGYIRIAGGLESHQKAEKIGERLKEALSSV